MKNVKVFTKSDFLSRKYGIELFIDEEQKELNTLIEKNNENLEEKEKEEEYYEERSLLRIALDGSMREDIYILLVENDKILGSVVIGYNEEGWSFVEKFKFAIRSVSVVLSERGKGHSLTLIENIFKLLNEKEITVIKQSSYTDDGKLKLKHNFNKISKQYNKIEFFEQN